MIIISCLYIVARWLAFSKLKLVRWGWLPGTISILVGVFIAGRQRLGQRKNYLRYPFSTEPQLFTSGQPTSLSGLVASTADVVETTLQ
jgi:hypothetical protein